MTPGTIPAQLDLFASLPPILLDPCGRNCGPCLAVYELGPSGPQLHCISCDGIAPPPRKTIVNRNSPDA
jgi:hypothetical protein